MGVTVETRQRFIGGMGTPSGWNASWPLAEVALSDGQGRLRLRVPLLRFLLRPWLPDFEFDAATVEATPHRGVYSSGVRFARPDGRSVVFWTFSPDEVLAAVADQRSQAA
jgi:hypothetical protein